MNQPRLVVNLIYRLFLFSWIFAILWVKGYLWWLFAVAALLLLVHILVTMSSNSVDAGPAQSAKSPAKGRASKAKEPDEGDAFSWREPRPPWSAQSTKKP